MKKILMIMGVAMLTALSSQAQIETPQPSPSAELHQMVGLTKFEIAYSRPGVKGRKVFGDLVPFGKMWRTGANKAVQFSISTDIKVEGKELKKGTYAMFTVPGEKQWDFVWYKETEIWGTPDKMIDSLVAQKVTVDAGKTESDVESFTIALDNVSNGKMAHLVLKWANTRVAVKIEVPTDEIAQASIDQVMAGPSASDYYRAASYYYDNKKELKKAYDWISKACEMRGEEAYWYFRKKSLIEAELGMFKEAIATAKISLKNAEAKGNDDYVKMNKESIEEWSKK